ncbi:transcription-repair coupling factor [Candidatus Magnetoovum chiemensis]|nr:transcription-repair coupling factor [Candidatus Magnetoovum chiemensis]
MSLKTSIEASLSHLYTNPMPKKIHNLRGSLIALFLCFFDKNFLLITKTQEQCREIYEDYNFYASLFGSKTALKYFPCAEDMDGIGSQLRMLLEDNKNISLAADLNTCLNTYKTPDELSAQSITLQRNESLAREDLAELLLSLGYRRVSMVIEKGEFSLRNYVLDLYPPNLENPVRIEFFADEIETIRLFAADTQRTIKHIKEISLFPISISDRKLPLYEIFNIEHIFYIYDAALDSEPLSSIKLPLTELSLLPIEQGGADAMSMPIEGLGITYKQRKSLSDIPNIVKSLMNKKTHILIVSSTKGQAERIREIFLESDMIVSLFDKTEIVASDAQAAITVGALNEGIYIDGFLTLTERELFGEVKRRQRPLDYKKSYSEGLIKYDDLKPGDYVVHTEHGIGVFEQLKHVEAEGFHSDMLVIRYEEGAKLYIPIYGIGAVKKYRAEEGVLPNLDKLGGKTWQKVKSRVKAKIKIAAEKLVRHYAERGVVRSYSASKDTNIHREFYDFFPYELTPDQSKAIEDIKNDMESDKPMDRLLCGDVGYGKTEIAMRACFKALYDGKQAAVLVPTTILCEQHYLTFKERFSAFPFKIDYISRFKPKKKNDETLIEVKQGKIDIIIGTHGLLRNTIDIPALGVLIIDEEHRFGVAQKEKIKELKKGVHCLSLSATPIPRTLQMAMSGIWNMSTIETPPYERQAVKTFISSFNIDIIKEAIERELSREGQVFVVHNRIRDIDRLAAKIIELFPNRTLSVAHGQMNEKDLEEIILKFMKGQIAILVSTAIIGSGIDIPRANTIIINRADMMGLADLHQLRGRVGRSSVRAYAYFFVPHEDVMTENAKRRLCALSDFSYLGAGFNLAMKDMEIRGAGNLLGAEQSGHVHAVGIDTYMEMLEEEIASLAGTPIETDFEPAIDLKIEAFIPDEYIKDVTQRLNFYRRIVVSKDEETLFSIEDELNDRFGKPPKEVINFIKAINLRLLMKKLKYGAITQLKDKVVLKHTMDKKYFSEDLINDIKKELKVKIKISNDSLEIVGIKDVKNDIITLCIDMLKIALSKEEPQKNKAFLSHETAIN